MDAAGETMIELGHVSNQASAPTSPGWLRYGWRGPLAVATVVLMALLTGAEPTTGYRPPVGFALPYGNVRIVGDTAVVADGDWVEAVELPQIVVRWRRPAPLNSFIMDVVGNVVVISNAIGRSPLAGDAYSFALDLATGKRLWEHPGLFVLSRTDQRLVVLFDGAELAAVDVDSGAARWSEHVGADGVPIYPQQPGEPLAILAADGRVRLVQPETGKVIALSGRTDRGFSSGWISEGVMVVSRGDPTDPAPDPVAIAYDLATLTELWRRALPRRFFSEIFPWSRVVVVPGDGDSLEALESRTGKRRWRRDLQLDPSRCVTACGSLVRLPDGETVLVGHEVDSNGLSSPTALFRVADGEAIATIDLWRVVGTHDGRMLVVRVVPDARLNTWFGWVDLEAGQVVTIDRLDGLPPGAECRVEGNWLLCANPPTRTMLLFRL